MQTELRPDHEGLWVSCELSEPAHRSTSRLKALLPASTVAGTCEPQARGSSVGEECSPSNHPQDNSRFPAQQAQGWQGLCMPGSLVLFPASRQSGFVQREESSPQQQEGESMVPEELTRRCSQQPSEESLIPLLAP